MKNLIILWLDDQRDPYKYLNTKSTSATFARNKKFYDNLLKSYNANFVWVKNLYQFISYIEKNGLPQFISFDYDLNNRGGGDGLSDEEKLSNNGVNCAKWLVNYCKKMGEPLPKFYIHSANPKHGPEINRVLTNENTQMKRVIRLTEQDLHKIVKESVNKILNEIGDTPKGQFMLGRLKYRNDYNYWKNNIIDPSEIDDYAEEAKTSQKKYPEDIMTKAYDNAERYEEYQNNNSTYAGDNFEKMCKSLYPIEKYIEEVNSACGTDDFRFDENVEDMYDEIIEDFINLNDERDFLDDDYKFDTRELQNALDSHFETDIYSYV